jgi:peptide/nickel transport system substrate-binding protein
LRSSPQSCECPSAQTTGEQVPTGANRPSFSVVNIRIQHEPATLLPLIDSDPVIHAIIDHDVLETLVRVSEDGLTIFPELADNFEVDDRQAIYTFYLAENARWHDGMPVTSFDVAFVLSKITDPYSTMTSAVFSNIREVSTPDDGTVVIALDRPTPDFLYAISTVPILPEHVFGRTPLSLHDAARAPVGSGPFRFVRWEPSRLIELERNMDWRGEPPGVDRIVYRIVPDDRIAISMFRQGDLDIVPALSANVTLDVPGGYLVTHPNPYLEAWMYNTTHAIFSDVAARRAVGSLVDRDIIRCAILRCRADLIADPWLLRAEGLAEPPTLPFDPKEAAEILARAGWRDRDNDGVLEKGGVDFSFSLLLPDLGRDVERTASVVQGDLAGVGIDMQILKVSRGAFVGRLEEGRFDVAGLSILARPMFDAWSLLNSGAIGSLDNFGSFRDAEMDEMLDALQTETDQRARDALMNRISRRVRRLQPVTFTFRPYETVLVRNTISNLILRDGWFEERQLRIGGGRP